MKDSFLRESEDLSAKQEVRLISSLDVTFEGTFAEKRLLRLFR